MTIININLYNISILLIFFHNEWNEMIKILKIKILNLFYNYFNQKKWWKNMLSSFFTQDTLWFLLFLIWICQRSTFKNKIVVHIDECGYTNQFLFTIPLEVKNGFRQSFNKEIAKAIQQVSYHELI